MVQGVEDFWQMGRSIGRGKFDSLLMALGLGFFLPDRSSLSIA
jgi:hypothetical protein